MPSPASRADGLACLAVRALVVEVCVSPKPGLVDRLNSGAHADMDLFTFVDSATCLFPYFRETARVAALHRDGPESLLPKLRPLGIRAEGEMLAATSGVNTHKGAIFSLGILCAAAAGLGDAFSPGELSARCAAVAGSPRRDSGERPTGGQRAFAEHGLGGILEEAGRGFPSVFGIALPALRERLLRGFRLQDAAVAALLHLIAEVADTNIVARRGPDTLHRIRAMVGERIAGLKSPTDYLECALELDREFIGENISPGGSADLLAATLFAHYVLPFPPG
ncbi:MAG: triphosphoribosyl-dephospho-CoA synthase [Treponema sp.]|nr:triphosphoribosyl-dephospho-CoA synthase [Treponema sp.]